MSGYLKFALVILAAVVVIVLWTQAAQHMGSF